MSNNTVDLSDPTLVGQSQYLDRWSDTYSHPRYVLDNLEFSPLPISPFAVEYSEGPVRFFLYFVGFCIGLILIVLSTFKIFAF